MHDSRAGDRTPIHYTMMAHTRPSPAPTSSHSYSLSQSSRVGKTNKTTTPSSSPHGVYSVGQNYPPKLSPARSEVRPSSPNYFGLVVDSAHDPRESSGLARDNWSPASSSIKSFGAALPKHVTLESNPEFEAFKRQVDINKGKSFALPTSHYVQPTSNLAPVRPQPPRWHTHTSDTGSETSFVRSLTAARDRPTSRMDIDQDSLHDSAYVSSDSKRNSESSLVPLQITSLPRFESPRPMDPTQPRTTLTRAEDRDPRLSIMEHRPEPPSPQFAEVTRAATMPIKLEPGQTTMIGASHLKELMEIVDDESVLILDIRSSQNFATSRIKGSLNLCIPTTLLKRATFNTEKLHQTFQGSAAGDKFATWKDMEWIIVYDSHSSDKRDAIAAQNMVKKFTNEGFNGETAILRGGFNGFQKTFPDLVDSLSMAEKAGRSTSPGRTGSLAPVIGGVMLPKSTNSFNPFFSNIRQNMDLADGVGQFDVSWPSGLEASLLPQWLREAAAQVDHGKKVSENFLRIELEEKSRMQNAYAAFNEGNPAQNPTMNGKVQLCGVEKGVKNRYKDILPFEHSRVRLQDKFEGDCDYINASHLTASRSNKRYIASQGPLPDTFEDFWSVVWEQDVRVVVMLTAESEGGQLKCHKYWKEREYGPIRLKLLSEKKASLDSDKHRSNSQNSPTASELNRRRANTITNVDATPMNASPTHGQSDTPHVVIRKFAVSHASHPFAPIREVTHLHFPFWPDFGTPAQPSHLLSLVELANVMQRASLPVETASVVGSSRPSDALPISWYDEPEEDSACRPMLVHCSAGCGRTGAFCTVDSVIDMLKRQRLNKLSLGQSQKNGGGDVSMADLGEPISPLTNRKMSIKLDLGGGSKLKPKVDDQQLDTSWLQDDSVDLIQRTVEDFREQRLSMVQSLRQFVLCYETILEYVNKVHDRGSAGPGWRRRSSSFRQSLSQGL